MFLYVQARASLTCQARAIARHKLSLLMSEAAAGSSSGTSSVYTDSTIELISSHLHRLQWEHDLLDSEHRVLRDRVALLEAESSRSAVRLSWLERFVQRFRNFLAGF